MTKFKQTVTNFCYISCLFAGKNIKIKMIKRNLITLTILIVFGFSRANAGWYECYNFSGTIDKSPVTLSIQIREDYFGEKDKKDFNVIGVYKSDKKDVPIRLEGKRNPADNKVVLYEITGGKRVAAFEFDFSENETTGFWENLLTSQKLPLNLKYASKIADTAEEDQFTNVEILQAHSLRDFYFIGVYSKIKNQADAVMTKLKIIRKTDNSLFQTLNFSKVEAPMGNLMTIIFDNVEADNKSKNFTIWSKVGRVGGYLTVNYNLRKKRFVLDPNPRIDGPN